MITGTNPDGTRFVTPETKAEELALEDIKNHRPFFAVAETYAISAFIRGFEAGKKHQETYANQS